MSFRLNDFWLGPAKKASRRQFRASDLRKIFLEKYVNNPINRLTGKQNYNLMKRGLKQREMEIEAQKIIEASDKK